MSATGKPTRLTHLTSIRYLRAIAALMVAYFHLVEQVPQYEGYFRNHLLGGLNLAAGVDVFFVISGFIMLVSNGNSTPATFAMRRIVRVVPLYWFLTTVVALIAIGLPGQLRTTVLSLGAYLK